MTYDPFAPGPFAVASRAGIAIDRTRDDRPPPFEVWYPESARAGRHPLIAYCHASFGHKRQSAYLSTHLASHGYVVTAADHTWNAAPDFADRVPDLRFLLDHILGGAVDGVSSAVDEQRIGLVGWSFGGWRYLRRSRLTSALRLSSRSRRRGTPHRCRASSPRRSRSPGSARSRRFYLVADATGSHHCPVSTSFSSGLRLAGGCSSFRALTIGTSTHQIVEPGPCSSAHAHTFTRGLSLAHLDADLRRDKAAQRFLEGDPVAALRERGVNALDYPRRSSA